MRLPEASDRAAVAEQPNQTKVIQTRPKAAAGEGESNLIHVRVHTAAPQGVV
jgi:hypothetical protein